MYLQAKKAYEKATVKEWTISGKAQKAIAGNVRFLPFSPCQGHTPMAYTLNLCTLNTEIFSNFSCFSYVEYTDSKN